MCSGASRIFTERCPSLYRDDALSTSRPTHTRTPVLNNSPVHVTYPIAPSSNLRPDFTWRTHMPLHNYQDTMSIFDKFHNRNVYLHECRRLTTTTTPVRLSWSAPWQPPWWFSLNLPYMCRVHMYMFRLSCCHLVTEPPLHVQGPHVHVQTLVLPSGDWTSPTCAGSTRLEAARREQSALLIHQSHWLQS